MRQRGRGRLGLEEGQDFVCGQGENQSPLPPACPRSFPDLGPELDRPGFRGREFSLRDSGPHLFSSGPSRQVAVPGGPFPGTDVCFLLPSHSGPLLNQEAFQVPQLLFPPHANFPGLPQQSTTNYGVQTAEMYFLTVLGARSPRPRCQQGGALAETCRGQSLLLFQLLVSPAVPGCL